MDTSPLTLQLRLDPQALTQLRQFHAYTFEPTVTAIVFKWLARWVRNPPEPPDPDQPETFAWVLRHSRHTPGQAMMWLHLHGDLAAVLHRRSRAYREAVADRMLTVHDLASAIINAEGCHYANLKQYTYENPPPPTPWRGALGGSLT